MKPKYLPISVSGFRTMIEGNYIYIDKTKWIYDLFSAGNRYYFLSRPRRFGKSLLIATLKELFLNNRKLFKGLWIDSSDYQWQEYPVIHLDFGSIDRLTPERFETSLSEHLEDIARNYKVNISAYSTPSDKFSFLIKQLANVSKVVILVDEYDKPILDALPSIEKAVVMRNILKSFYEAIKGSDDYIRAVFITGVTKFARTSLFSGLNNLKEITIDSQFNALVGYTAQEIQNSFTPQLQRIAQQENCTVEELTQKIALWYDGYSFSPEKDAVRIYNPFSTLLFLEDGKYDDYWFQTGTPSFLLALIKMADFSIINIEKVIVHKSALGAFDIEKISLKTLLFQTGYLTIDYFDENSGNYHLKLPNFEVRSAFFTYIFDVKKRNIESWQVKTVDQSVFRSS